MSPRLVVWAMIVGLTPSVASRAQTWNLPGPTSGPISPQQAPSSSVQLLQASENLTSNPSLQSWNRSQDQWSEGRNGPIGHEIYLLTGPTIPAGSGVLAQNLNTGWMVEGGGRTLFFHPDQNRAWTIRFGITFQENQGHDAAPTYPLFGMTVRTRSLYRYSATTALGREWFRHGNPAWSEYPNTLRFGFDFGARWGGQRLNLDVIDDPIDNTTYRHYHDIFGGVVVGLQGGVEFPRPSWVWHTGFRAEYGYNWSNMIRGQNSNIHDVNLLLTTGFRY